MYILIMNDIRHASLKMNTAVCQADTEAELVNFLESEKVQPFNDGEYRKYYKKGGPLEWFNVPMTIYGQGTRPVPSAPETPFLSDLRKWSP